MSEQTDDFTQLVNANIDRVDLVDKAANGTTILFAKAAEAEQQAGLFSPDLVRDLVAKAEAAEPPASSAPESVTLTGSPAAIAKMIHAGAVRKAEPIDPELDRVVKAADSDYVEFVKAKYSAEQKRKLLAQGHAMRNAAGEPDYPVHDEDDLGKAIHAVGRGGADHDKIRRYVMRRAKEMGKSDLIPDNWAPDGSLKQAAAVSKAFGDAPGGMPGTATDPGSPSWEAQDAASAKALIDRILGLIPGVKALAQREGAEVGNGHMEDLADICDLEAVQDALMCAAKTLGGFAVSEQAEAGASVAKATQDPAPQPAAAAAPVTKESIVSETETASQAGTEPVAKADGTLTEAELAEIGRAFLVKKAAKKAKQTSGAEGAPADTARTIPGTDTVQAPAAQDDVAKAMAGSFATVLSEAMAPVVKQLGELTAQAKDQQERVEKAMQRPDDRNSPALNGATGAFQVAERDHAGSPVRSKEFQAVQKALEELPEGEVRDSARAAVGVAAIKARFGG